MKETVKVLAGQGLTYVLQLAFVVLGARILGPAGQGQFALLRTAVYLGEAFLWLGLASGLTYLVAKDFQKYHDPLFKASLGYLVLAVAGVAVGLELASGRHANATLGVILENRLLLLCWLATLALLQLVQRTFLGQQRFSLYNRVYIINAAAALLLLLLLVLGLSGGASVPAVARVSIVASGLAVAYALWAHRDHLDHMWRSTVALLPAVREAYAVGMKGYASSLAFLVLYRLDFFFVAHFLGTRALGVYTVAVFVIEAVQKVPDWLGLILAPQVAAGRDESGKLARRYATTALAVVASFALAIGLLARWEGGFLRLALGDGYQGVEAVLLLLIPRALLHAIMVTYAGYLAGRGYTFYHPLAGVTGVTTLCAIDILAIPHYKLQGAVVGITAAYLVATVVILLGYRENRRARLLSN